MATLVLIFIGAIVAIISHWWLNVLRTRNKLKWLPQVPRLPILGNIFELRNSTEVLNVFSTYCEKYNGLCTIELLTNKYIVASEPEFLEFLLSKMEILNKTDDYKFLEGWLGTGLLTAEEQTWKKSRKMLNPSFHFSILENFIDTFNTNADILVELLEKEVGQNSFDIYPYVAMSALDIICETAMGVSVHAQSNPKSEYVNAIKEKLHLFIERTYSPIKRLDILYPLTSDYYDDKKCLKILHSETLKVIIERRKKLDNKHTTEKNEEDLGIKKKKVILDLLLESTLDGKPLTNDEIRQEVDTFMFAGHDTTSNSLGFTLYCLSNNPEVQNKAAEEQKLIFENDRHRPATYKDLQDMKYLEMVIKESLRLYPSVPYVGRKTTRDVKYKDNIIPKGTGILVIIYYANKNPKYYTNPYKFDPSRFEENKNYSQYTYLPFSAGPRNCIGQKFAMLEMKAVLSKILRNLEIQPSGRQLLLSAQAVLTSLNGVHVKLKKRQF